ncbi:uncharacterized protein E0L32_005766 [Thyridium curvatum]|uniref:Carrier domain-containing protein n=1 Tax=Thyridium curvatum TaxID=1093900 RepID=A0A507AV32_9PEZI|nr:uncharacterized protein E0L32_005766 [Thyridium curvatum]TPX13822.1 hypothetical protein E0L32_005766 [Thyridium curvatum]
MAHSDTMPNDEALSSEALVESQDFECSSVPTAAKDRLVYDVFYDQVKLRPLAPAVHAWDGDLTYSQLDELSSRLAAHISSFGVRPDDIVPILCDKAAVTIVCMLAVLKANGAFVALDVSHPDERLQEIIQGTKATLLLTSPNQHDRLSHATGLRRVDVSMRSVADLSSSASPLNHEAIVSPNNLMYAVFTSGSTGRPKGVMIEHQAFVTSALAHGSDQNLSPESRVLQFASYAFDPSLMDIFTTLIFGGCVCVPTEEERLGDIADFVNRAEVNTLMVTPSYAKLLDPASMPGLKQLGVGGESVPSDLMKKWLPHVDVYISYGPAEASIQAAGLRVERGSIAPPSGTIGYPTGCVIDVVEESQYDQTAEEGEFGELLIEGPTLARGYLDDRAKTEASFFTRTIGGVDRRTYKTGDLVRRHINGTIQFVGRKDTQVKVHGMRVELSEIETRLSNVPCLSSDLKVAVEKVEHSALASQSALVAFISGSTKAGMQTTPEVDWDQTEELQSRVPGIQKELEKFLPVPLVPSIYVPLSFLPFTSSHKTDRTSLRRLVSQILPDELQRLQGARDLNHSTRPCTQDESALRELWALALERPAENIGPDSHFIHLGGDSVTSIKLVTIARSRGVHLTSTLILSSPILSDMAENAFSTGLQSGLHPIQPFSLLPQSQEELCTIAAGICRVPAEEVEDVVPMAINQMRWYAQTLTRPEAWLDQHYFRLPADTDLVQFQTALNATTKTAELLRSRVIIDSNKRMLFAVIKPQPVELEIVSGSLETYLAQDIQNPMGLGMPLSRYVITKDAKTGEQAFVWTIHHAIYDGYSISMLLQMIDQLYRGSAPTPLTPFKHYMKEQSQEYLMSGDTFWKDYLASASWVEFPTIPPPENKQPPSSERFTRTMGITAPPGITVANMIRVAYAIALSKHCADPTDVLFLESTGGRNSSLPGIGRVAGPTLVTVPTRILLPPARTDVEVLAVTQTSLAKRMMFEDFPIQRLLPLCPPLELRSILTIDDEAFLSTGIKDGLFRDGNTALRVDESRDVPLMFRCTLRGTELDVHVRFDGNIVRSDEIEEFVGTFEDSLGSLRCVR